MGLCFYLRGVLFFFRFGLIRIQVHNLNAPPIPGRSLPALWVSGAGVFVDDLTPIQERCVDAGMALDRGDETDRTMAMFMVVPVHQASDPLPGRREVGKGLQRIRRAIFKVLNSDSENGLSLLTAGGFAQAGTSYVLTTRTATGKSLACFISIIY